MKLLTIKQIVVQLVEDSSGAGEDRNQRGTRDHARGTAPEGEKWLKANPRNEW